MITVQAAFRFLCLPNHQTTSSTHTNTLTLTLTHKHKHKHKHTYTYTHTHTHTHTHTLSPPPSDLHQSEVGLGRHVRQCSSHLEWISGPLLRGGSWTGFITSWPRR